MNECFWKRQTIALNPKVLQKYYILTDKMGGLLFWYVFTGCDSVSISYNRCIKFIMLRDGIFAVRKVHRICLFIQNSEN